MSVQALQRKHEGLERDLAALEDKVKKRNTEFVNTSFNFLDQGFSPASCTIGFHTTRKYKSY